MTEVIKTVTQADTVRDPEIVKRRSCAETLKERRGDVVCFTPALLVTHGKMPVDPVREFISRFPAPADQQPFCFELQATYPAFFSGLGVSVLNGESINWDRRLYAVPASRANLCLDFLGGIGLHGDNFFASSVTYTLSVPDPTSLIPTDVVEVRVFGVLIDSVIVYLAPRNFSSPVVATISAEQAGLKTASFQINELTQEAGKLFRGEQ